MNTTTPPRGGRTCGRLLALGYGLFITSATASDSQVPRGTLNVDRELVRTGTSSQLDWKIEYPTPQVVDIVDVLPPQRIVPKKDVTMKVRVLGVAFQSGSKQLPLDGYYSLNGSSWERFFYGDRDDVEPGKVLLEKRVGKGTYIDFGARGWNRRWLPFHHTRTDDPYVIVLKNGDRAPDYAPAYDQGSVVSFLKPYIDKGGNIRIGERDLIVLWEASTSKPGSRYFDMQDLVILVTFE